MLLQVNKEVIMENFQPILIADYACEIGENPLWHPFEQKLYWVDITAGRLFRYEPATGEHERCYQGRPVGGFTIQKDGAFLLFMDRGTVANWRDGVLSEVISDLPEELSTRFNDVIADPQGRVFCGTMSTPERKGRLYRLDTDRTIHLILEDVGCSNGMAFSGDMKIFYHTDSFAREICMYDYAAESGRLENRRVFVRFEEAAGLPDGLTVDAEGGVWTAVWDGSCVVRLLPSGEVERKISLPARKVSSLTFGGPELRDMYITTAGGNSKEEDGVSAGALFCIRGQALGKPEFFSRIAVPELTPPLRTI